MPLRPGEVGAVGREGDFPSLAPRLLVEGGSGHQEFADELGLICETSSGGYISGNQRQQAAARPRVARSGSARLGSARHRSAAA